MSTHEILKQIKAKESKLSKLEKNFASNLLDKQTAIFESLNKTQSLFDDSQSQSKILQAIRAEIKADKYKLMRHNLAFLDEQETKGNLKLIF